MWDGTPDGVRFLGPRDDRAGGTWIGVNAAGVVAALANRHTERDLPRDRSRGLLVRDVLRHGSAEGAVRWVENDLDERSYGGFTLVVADRTAALRVAWDGRRAVAPLEPGVHVITNVGSGDRPASQNGTSPQVGAGRLRERLAVTPNEGSEAWLDRAATTFADHDRGVCVHGDEFGTRSASFIRVNGGIDYRYAAGPPCEASVETVPHDLDAD